MATDASGAPVRRYSNVALDTAIGQLITLEGAARDRVEELRPRCATLEVRCPVEGCQSPELSVTVGYVRADGTEVTAYFSHKAGGGDGGHGPAGYARTRIKHQLKGWATDLGFEAAVDQPVGAGRTVDVMIAGPARFGIQISVSGPDEEPWSAHNRDLEAVGMVPRWLWLAPRGSCGPSFDLSHLTERYRGDRNGIWLAGVDTEDDGVKLAAGSGLPAGPSAERFRPRWCNLEDIGLDQSGFVDLTVQDAVAQTEEGRSRSHSGSVQRDLFWTPQDDDDLGPSLLGDWSPEELAVPGTRWMRDVLQDRRHQQFLDGVPPNIID